MAVVALVLLVERRHHLRNGRLFAVYIAGYAVGRFLVERMRIDSAHTIAGLRVNEWTSIFACAGALAFIVTGQRRHPGASRPDECATAATGGG